MSLSTGSSNESLLIPSHISANSCVSIWSQDRAKPVLNDWGNLTTPSFVSFTDKGRLYGDAAKYRAPKHPSSTVVDFKRLLGWKYSDPDVQRANTNTPPYGIVERHGIPFIQVVHRGEMKEYVSAHSAYTTSTIRVSSLF